MCTGDPAHHVLHGTGTFETEPPGAADMAARRADVLAKGLPYLVAERPDDGAILGFAYCNWFKPRPAYRFSAEDSIYLADDARGRGVGTTLLEALIEAAEAAGVRKLIAVIGDAANLGSIGVTSQSYLRIPLGVMFGMLFFGETLLRSTWLGLAFVLVGVVAMTWPTRTAKPIDPPPA